MNYNVCPLLRKFFGKPRHKKRRDKTAGNDEKRYKTVHALVFEHVFRKIQTAGVSVNCSRAAENAGENDEEKLLVFEKELQIMPERRRRIV